MIVLKRKLNFEKCVLLKLEHPIFWNKINIKNIKYTGKKNSGKIVRK